MLFKNFGLAVVVIAGLALTTGCDPLTRDRFEMISVDMSNQEDVRRTIGKPTYVREQEWHYERPTRHLNVLVSFDEQGVVTRKQWIDAENNEWIDTQPPEQRAERESTRVRTRR